MNTMNPTEEREHEIKCWPEFFQHVLDGSKPFEIRLNDRDYKVGDYLRILEWDPKAQEHTGKEVMRQVTYITNWMQAENTVVIGIAALTYVTADYHRETVDELEERLRSLVPVVNSLKAENVELQTQIAEREETFKHIRNTRDEQIENLKLENQRLQASRDERNEAVTRVCRERDQAMIRLNKFGYEIIEWVKAYNAAREAER